MAKSRQIKPKSFTFLKEKDDHMMWMGENNVILLVPKTLDENLVFRNNDVAKLKETPLPTRIRKMREGLGMTQKDLAQAAGLSQGEVSAIENGSSQPGRRIMKLLQEAMGVDFLFFE
jgi:DNA-binding XRE family transcriptional regulator